MDLADLVIIVLMVSALFRGADSGLVRQLLSAGGFIGGLFLGAWLEPWLFRAFHVGSSSAGRSWMALGVTLGLAISLLIIGDYVGNVIKKRYLKHLLGYLDWGLGALVGVVTLLIAVWLMASILLKLPASGLQQEVRGSWIVRNIDNQLPSAPKVIASISHLIDPNGFPQVFNGIEPAPVNPNISLPTDSAIRAAVVADEASVVKIEGLGCGGIVEGSGFVVDPGIVLTNAHVVAGVERPQIIDNNGHHSVSVIWFDPNLDLAVLKSSGLSGSPLKLNNSIQVNGTSAAVIGYPGGGPLTANPAVILDEFTAVGQNIYNQGNVSRDVYEIKATVVPGNSGGPLISTNGNVIGIVFAQSTTYNQVGYSLTLSQVTKELHQAEAQGSPVSTGSCAE